MYSGNVDGIGKRWISFQNGNDPCRFVRDGHWCLGETPRADLVGAVGISQVGILFEFLSVDVSLWSVESDDICPLRA